MRAWRRWLLVGVVVVVGAAVSTGQHGHGAAAAADDAATLQSRQLAAAPDLPPEGPELTGSQGADLAADLATRVPLPAGGNFNGIEWSELDGTIGASLVQAVVEYNAACQWYRALRDGRQTADARRVIAEVPAWQASRGRETGALAAAVAADVAAGGGDALTGVLRQCDDAHRREVAYAGASGKAGER
jgi:hypothetical protein